MTELSSSTPSANIQATNDSDLPAPLTGGSRTTNPFTDLSAVPAPLRPPSLAPTSTPLDITEDMNRATPPAPQQHELPSDPSLAVLQGMFPDFEDAILHSVLDSVEGNQDRAIDALLVMSDPEYKSDVTRTEPVLSQTELDEQFARRLMLEEQEHQQQAWLAQNTQPPPPPPQLTSRPQASTPATGNDTVAEFQQQFNKIAESGKKTFGSLISKVKAKIQELDQPKPGHGSSTTPIWGSESAGKYQQPHHGQPQPSYPAQYHQQPTYYDPNAQISPSPAPHSPQYIGAPATVAGYDTTPSSVMLSPASGVSIVPSSPRQAQTGSGAPIDGGKLGLLPKRPVSLLRSSSLTEGGSKGQHQIKRHPSEDESDGLEYTENPFEEPKK